MICSFCGSNTIPEENKPKFEMKIMDIIKHYPDVIFYVGNNDKLNEVVLSTLKK